MPPSRVCLTFDFDALSVWFGYERVTPAMLQRGEYGARVGVPRLLERLGALASAGDVLHPGSHASSRSRRSARRSSARATRSRTTPTRTSTPAASRPTRSAPTWSARSAALERLGVRPLGYRSPSADMSPATLPLLEEHGFLYDSSLMADDFRPYRPRIGDRGHARAAACSAAARRACGSCRCASSSTTGRTSSSNSGPVPGRALGAEQGARDLDGGVRLDARARRRAALLTVCMHPQVIGRGHRMAMLERFVEHCTPAGARFARMGDVASGLG